MKAAVFHGPWDVRFEDVPPPALNEGDILLRVRACGICGSDLHTYRHGMFETLGAPLESGGRVMGHEFCGEIAEISGDVPGRQVGDRVCTVGMGANAEYYRVPAMAAAAMLPIPPSVSFEEAATVEPLATSLHAANLGAAADGETHVIMGAGIIGLGILQVLKARSSVRTVVVDLSDRRLAVAGQLGADVVINGGREDAVARILELGGAEQVSFMPEPLGSVDVVYDAAGLPLGFTGTPVVQQAIRMVKQEGRVVVVSVFEKPAEVEMNIIVRKGVKLLGSWAWSFGEFRDSMELIGSGKIDRKPLITHEFPLEKASEAYETQLDAEASVKVLLIP